MSNLCTLCTHGTVPEAKQAGIQRDLSAGFDPQLFAVDLVFLDPYPVLHIRD